MNLFSKMKYTKYGSDELQFGIMIVEFILVITNLFIKSWILLIINILLLLWYVFRTRSSNYNARRKENRMFLKIFGKPFYKLQKYMVNHSQYKYYKCPKCKTKMRVPRGKGQVTITCPNCKTKFDKRT